MLCKSLVLAAAVLTIGGVSATAEVRTRQDAKGTVYEVDGIASDPSGCHPFPLQGKIVGRRFAPNSVALDSLTLEQSDGTRTIVNVDQLPQSLSRADHGSITAGLQWLSRVGRMMRGRAFACGAAGRVSLLDEIR